MKYRKLRIAWSVAWGIISLLLFGLGVRSRESIDVLDAPFGSTHVNILSLEGRVCLMIIPHGKAQGADPQLRVKAYPVSLYGGNERSPYWRWKPMRDGRFEVRVPHWFGALTAAAVAGISWNRWQFSLRTLLTAMTAAAIGLGWVVYAIRK